MLAPVITPEEWEAVLSYYEIGPLIGGPQPGGGTANANLTLESTTGVYFLKRRNPKYALPAYVAFDHRLMEHLAPYRVGTPLAELTSDGRRWLEWNGAVYELYPYQPGGPHDRYSLPQLASAGRSLAAYHRATRTFAPPPGKEWPRYQDPRKIREGIDALQEPLKGRLPPEEWRYLQEQVVRLEQEFPDERYHALPKLVVHGDYHPGNLKFLGEAVSGIFDLDWATVQPRLLDLADGVFLFAGERDSAIDAGDIVSLTQTWRPSPARARVFLEAYLETESVEPEEWAALDLLIRARWLYCRVAGQLKLPPERRLEYVLDGLLEPLRALDTLKRLF
jgi:homoserine kinase type II